MHNWSTDQSKFKNKDKKIIWQLEQLINYGLGNAKLDKVSLKKYLHQLKLDPFKRKYIEFILNENSLQKATNKRTVAIP